MKKHSSPNLTIRQTFWFGWKLVIILSVSLCVLALLRLQRSQSQLSSSSSSSSSSSYILSRRSRIPVEFYGNPKIAFLFLTRQNLPLDFLWQTFFEDAEVANFSIYIHSEPGFVFDESTTRSALFYNRQLSNSIKVGWGESSMIEAERLLLGEALGDPANQRFVLLSDSCVPLYNFSYIYKYLMASPKSFVDSFLDKKEGRYNPKMSPVIPKSKWRKGSQWIALVRKHAEVVVDDEKILPVFKKFCKRRPPLDASKGKQNSMSELVNQKSSVQGKVPSGYFNAMFDLTGAWLNDAKLQKQHNCIPDEHYMQTLLAMSDLEGELEWRTVTYTSWNQSTTNMETKGWHPFTFNYATAGPKQIQKIKDINHVYYETEYRTEWCSNNSTLVPCFLIARKFSKGAAMRLLSEGVVGRFDASALLNTQP